MEQATQGTAPAGTGQPGTVPNSGGISPVPPGANPTHTTTAGPTQAGNRPAGTSPADAAPIDGTPSGDGLGHARLDAVGARQAKRASLVAGFPGWLVAGAVYLAAAVVMWWHVWTGQPTSAMTCGCGDPASFVWFLAWPAYAMSHGHSLFLATQSHFPGGINMLDNTSELGLGVVLAPVTWLFGPIATLNVALTAAPALTALTTYGVVRRVLHLGWPAAFLAGLSFGFSPFMLRNEAANHVQTSFLVLLPLIFWCGYELAVAQRGRWWRWGAGLGVLTAAQFFVGTDILLVTAITTALALVLGAVAVLTRKGLLWTKLPYAGRGFLLAGAVAAVLLAYPLRFALAGPQHIKGANWWNAAGNGLGQVLLPLGPTPFQRSHWPVEGYMGPVGTYEGYLGIASLVILAIAVVVVRRPLARLCGVMTLITVWFSLGSNYIPIHSGGEPSWLWLPWRAFTHVPVLEKMTPVDFGAAATWFIALAGALLVDRILPRTAASAGTAAPATATAPAAPAAPRTAPSAGTTAPATATAPAAPPAPAAPGTPATSGPATRAREGGTRIVAAALVSAALLVPWLFSWSMPFTTNAVTTPSWVAHGATRLPSGAVVLFYPFPASYQDQALVWQARQGMRYAVVGGRGITSGRDGSADHGWTPGTAEGTLTALSVPWEPHYSHLKLPPLPGPDTIASFRSALRSWQVTDVVVMPEGRNPVYARQWLTAVLGTAPRLEDGAWVWANVQRLVS